MMKRLLIYILSCFCFVLPASANIKIDADIASSVIQQHFKTKTAQSSAIATLTQAASVGNGTVSASDLWDVCVAGGLDIKKAGDKQKCEEFAYQLIKALGVDYKEVCGKDAGKTGGTEVCEKEIFKSVRVNVAPGAALSQEYVRVKYNDDSLRCDGKNVRTEKRDDYLKCTSANNNAFYEFRFDTLDAFKDSKIQSSIEQSVCNIHDTKFTGSRCYKTEPYQTSSGMSTTKCSPSGCGAVNDEAKCEKIKETAARFGYSVEYHAPVKICGMIQRWASKPEDLKNDFVDQGIDSFYFCSDNIQIKNNLSFRDAIIDYLSTHLNVPASSVECNDGFQTYTGAGCGTSFANAKDDIVSCHIGDKNIDLVFDDVNEWSTKRHKGGMSGITCLNSDGTFDGANCRLLGEENCQILADSVIKYCPECRAPQWDGTTCNMPDSASVDNLNKGLKIAAGVGAAAVGVTLFFVPGAQGGSLAILSYVGGALVVGGAATKVTSNIVMQTAIFGPFADEAEACNNEECAKRLLTEALQKISSYKKEFTPDEQKACDALFNHLVNQIPGNSDFWDKFLSNEEIFDPVTCEVKTKAQPWQIARQLGEGAEILGSLLRIADKLFEKTTQTITKKVGERSYAFGMHTDRAGSRMWVYGTETLEAGRTQTSSYLASMGLKHGSQLTKEGANTVLQSIGLSFNDISGAVFTDATRSAIRLTNGTVIPALFKQSITGTGSVTHVVFNLRGLINPAWGTIAETTAGGVYYGAKTSKGYRLPKCLQTDSFEPSIEIVEVEEENIKPTGDDDAVYNGGGADVINSGTGDTTVIVPTEITEPTETIETIETTISGSDSSNTTGSTSASERFRPQRSKNTGLIAAAAVLGTVAVGGVIGGLVVASDKKDDKANTNNVNNVNIDAELETLMQNTRVAFGSVNNNPLRLKVLPTVVNSNAPIVLINGQPVVVVMYKTHKIPFWVQGSSWMPLLGIGNENNYFNIYPSSENIKNNAKLNAIVNALNASFNPAIVARYTGQLPGTVAFPTAAAAALTIINSEFTNGVLQSQNVTDADRRLYNANYRKIQDILK